MKIYNEAEFWFVTGSQCLYGEETLREVERHAVQIVESVNQNSIIPATIIYKPVVKAPEEISRLIKDANYNDKCSCYMHMKMSTQLLQIILSQLNTSSNWRLRWKPFSKITALRHLQLRLKIYTD